MEYTTSNANKPISEICTQMIWRQQPNGQSQLWF